MNWINVALIVSVIVMVALGVYFLTWMTKSQRIAAAQYQEQMRAAAAAEALGADGPGEPGETSASDEPDEAAETAGSDEAAGGGLSDADRLKFREQHRGGGSV